MSVSRRHAQPSTFRSLVSRSNLRGGLTEGRIEDASLSSALAGGADPLGILAYLAGLSINVRTLNDLLLINLRDDEEELSAHRVSEGVAVTVASQGDWVLFRP